jgi:hemerythrin-like metal-binding protein
MALLQWRDEFRIGIEEVDHEHRELIATINRLAEACGAGDDAVARFLGELHARIAAHFALEEKVMKARRYDQFDDHKADHERLLGEIRDIMDAHEAGDRSDTAALGADLDVWFSEHFRSKDARFHRSMHGAQPGRPV